MGNLQEANCPTGEIGPLASLAGVPLREGSRNKRSRPDWFRVRLSVGECHDSAYKIFSLRDVTRERSSCSFG